MKGVKQLRIALLLAVLAPVPLGDSAHAQTPAESLEVILAIDTSKSMQPVLQAAKAAASEFVARMPEGVRIGVETFADRVTVLTPPTTDRALIRQKIESIVTGGDTALYDVVVAASQHFTPTAGNKVLVLLSDGKDEGSTATLDDAVASVEGVRVEAISLTTPQTDLTSLAALGPVTSADDAAAMSAAFARVAGLLVEEVESTTTPPTITPPTTTTPATPATTLPSTAMQSTVAASTTVAAAAIDRSPPSTLVAVVTSTDASPASALLWIGAAGLFLGLFLLAFLLFPRNRVSKARLGIEKPRSVSEIGVRTTTAIEDALERYGKRSDLGTVLAVADISIKPAEFVALVALVAAIAGFVGLLFGGPIVALVVAAAVCLAVRLYVLRAKAQRQAAFADQLPDVLQLVTTALRSGFGITQALDSVAEEAEEPARSEFAHVLVEARMGRDLSDSMRVLARRMASQDLEWVVAAIDINRETGGNLSEILRQVSATIRERARMNRHVRTLTAEGRLSAQILTGLPLVMLVWQWRVNPDNFALLTGGVGLIALAIAGILIVLGGLWVHNVVKSVAL
jgi:tight adherence protein B